MRERRIRKFRLDQPDSFPSAHAHAQCPKAACPSHKAAPRACLPQPRSPSPRERWNPVGRPHSGAFRYRNRPDFGIRLSAQRGGSVPNLLTLRLEILQTAQTLSRSSRFEAFCFRFANRSKSRIRIRRLQSVVGDLHRLHTIRQGTLRRQPPFGFRSYSGRVAERLQPKALASLRPRSTSYSSLRRLALASCCAVASFAEA